MNSTLQDEMITRIAKDLSKDIDREVLWGMLSSMGWIRVMLPTLGNGEQAVDIIVWLEENCKGGYERSGRDFIFEEEKDANWFKLRWLG
jgi:hypothetical protein